MKVPSTPESPARPDDVLGRPCRLLVLLNYGATLAAWRRAGLAERELRYYRVMQGEGLSDTAWVTYDTDADEHASFAAPVGLNVKGPDRGDLAYSVTAVWRHRGAFRRADVIKTNQSHGAWMGAIWRLIARRSIFVVRCGYVRTPQIMGGDENRSLWAARRERLIEWLTMRVADAVIVTTEADRSLLVERYGVKTAKIHVVPNSIDTELFCPPSPGRDWARPLRLLFIGRLVPLKNVEGAIDGMALARVDARLTVVGDGHRREALESLARERGAPVEFAGSVANDQLPAYLKDADVLLLPQWYGAGMSKVMIEAMACGALVVASDIEAHRQVITDGVNGFLCDPNPEGIAACLRRVDGMAPEALARVSRQAADDALVRYSMRAAARHELGLYAELLVRRRGRARRRA